VFASLMALDDSEIEKVSSVLNEWKSGRTF